MVRLGCGHREGKRKEGCVQMGREDVEIEMEVERKGLSREVELGETGKEK